MSAVADVVTLYNRATNRNLSARSHEKFIRPRLKEGVSPVTLKLAILGASLKPHYLGFNDRRQEYLDPETIFKVGRFDGHADYARTATHAIERAAEVWDFWRARLKVKTAAAVMEHFFRIRDELLVAEGGTPLGPWAAYSSREPGEAWL